jgi:ribosomal protein L37AE/L43A
MTDIEAKCPTCANKALVNEEMTEVKCRTCGFTATYDNYLEIMKSKALQMADNVHLDWDKN